MFGERQVGSFPPGKEESSFNGSFDLQSLSTSAVFVDNSLAFTICLIMRGQWPFFPYTYSTRQRFIVARCLKINDNDALPAVNISATSCCDIPIIHIIKFVQFSCHLFLACMMVFISLKRKVLCQFTLLFIALRSQKCDGTKFDGDVGTYFIKVCQAGYFFCYSKTSQLKQIHFTVLKNWIISAFYLYLTAILQGRARYDLIYYVLQRSSRFSADSIGYIRKSLF